MVVLGLRKARMAVRIRLAAHFKKIGEKNMKRFICLLLMIMLIPTCVFATGSPTTQRLIYNKSNIPVYMVNDTRIFDQFDAIEEMQEKLITIFEGEDFLIDDMFLIVLEKKEEKVKWHFTRQYDLNTKVVMVLFNEIGYYILEGFHFLKYIVFDFTDVPKNDTYNVVILSK